jgi:hypothetical protein
MQRKNWVPADTTATDKQIEQIPKNFVTSSLYFQPTFFKYSLLEKGRTQEEGSLLALFPKEINGLIGIKLAELVVKEIFGILLKNQIDQDKISRVVAERYGHHNGRYYR